MDELTKSRHTTQLKTYGPYQCAYSVADGSIRIASVMVAMKFEGDMDDVWSYDFSWIHDFYLSQVFDQTTIVAQDHPKIDALLELDQESVFDLRFVESKHDEFIRGPEAEFIKMVTTDVSKIVTDETQGKVTLVSVELKTNE